MFSAYWSYSSPPQLRTGTFSHEWYHFHKCYQRNIYLLVIWTRDRNPTSTCDTYLIWSGPKWYVQLHCLYEYWFWEGQLLNGPFLLYMMGPKVLCQFYQVWLQQCDNWVCFQKCLSYRVSDSCNNLDPLAINFYAKHCPMTAFWSQLLTKQRNGFLLFHRWKILVVSSVKLRKDWDFSKIICKQRLTTLLESDILAWKKILFGMKFTEGGEEEKSQVWGMGWNSGQGASSCGQKQKLKKPSTIQKLAQGR